jgi:hypothetical protein
MRATFEYVETWTKKLSLNKCPPEGIIDPTPKIEIVIPTVTPTSKPANLTDEELCALTPAETDGLSPGPVTIWDWWSDTYPIENATASCTNYYHLLYTGQHNDLAIFQFATKAEALDRYENEIIAQDQWLGDSGYSSSLELGDAARQWTIEGAETKVLAIKGPFFIFGQADNLGTDQCDLDGDGGLDVCEIYEVLALRIAETIANIEKLPGISNE